MTAHRDPSRWAVVASGGLQSAPPAGVAQWLESQSSKLVMRVRFSSPALFRLGKFKLSGRFLAAEAQRGSTAARASASTACAAGSSASS
ncbi:hypothetical protein BN381_80086 [Candidatus Microthrix parvicella RN1]|uniref:Uncharacterized protein n=1 Tax=Candidatus Neomicrothrix parvicella RN1 TaxID=1229780 RepID=R4Z6R1_9ACTN|nr:hypothetical protein BN381_80086 [Candidatus Microthrix parvicella RN1]